MIKYIIILIIIIYLVSRKTFVLKSLVETFRIVLQLEDYSLDCYRFYFSEGLNEIFN